MGDLIASIFVGIAKAINAPAEERAKIIADEIAQHTGALADLAQLGSQGSAALGADRAEIDRLKAEHAVKDAEIARLRAALPTGHSQQ